MTPTRLSLSGVVPSLPVVAGLAQPCPAPQVSNAHRPVVVRRGTARRARPVPAPQAPPTVNLSPLNATLTKYEGGPVETALLRAQVSPDVSVRPVAAWRAVPVLSIVPIPTVNLTPLNATFTENEGVPVES